MPHPITFPHREPMLSSDTYIEAFSPAVEDAAIQQAFERGCETMIQAVNFLEALCASLRRQTFVGSHLSVVTEDVSAKRYERG